MTKPVTLDRLDHAITRIMEAMMIHPNDAAAIMPTLERLEAERDRLASKVDPVEYARRGLAGRRSAAA